MAQLSAEQIKQTPFDELYPTALGYLNGIQTELESIDLMDKDGLNLGEESTEFASV